VFSSFIIRGLTVVFIEAMERTIMRSLFAKKCLKLM